MKYVLAWTKRGVPRWLETIVYKVPSYLVTSRSTYIGRECPIMPGQPPFDLKCPSCFVMRPRVPYSRHPWTPPGRSSIVQLKQTQMFSKAYYGSGGQETKQYQPQKHTYSWIGHVRRYREASHAQISGERSMRDLQDCIAFSSTNENRVFLIHDPIEWHSNFVYCCKATKAFPTSTGWPLIMSEKAMWSFRFDLMQGYSQFIISKWGEILGRWKIRSILLQLEMRLPAPVNLSKFKREEESKLQIWDLNNDKIDQFDMKCMKMWKIKEIKRRCIDSGQNLKRLVFLSPIFDLLGRMFSTPKCPRADCLSS